MKYYVIPDIHGRNDLLQIALSFLKKENPDGGKIVFLGDYIDRGTDNVGVLKTVMKPPSDWEFICLKGNHEDMLVGSYRYGYEIYDRKAADEILRSDLSYEAVIDWMESLPIAHIIGKNIFAHAWYDHNDTYENQKADYVLWMRFSDVEKYSGYPDFHLTHGHTPRKHGPVNAIGRTNLDCGAVFYDRLVIAEYHEDKMGPQKFHEFVI